MASVSAVDVNSNTKTANYNAVKIQINNPKTNVNNGYNSVSNDNGVYNAVSIEVNNPSVELGNKHKRIYEYPQSQVPVTAEYVPLYSLDVPPLPVAYQTNNFINSRTLINAELEVEQKNGNKPSDEIKLSNAIAEEEVAEADVVEVPAPVLTTVEDEKAASVEALAQNATFKANGIAHPVEIVPPEDIKPDVDVSEVITKLSGDNFDIQAKQMEEIAKAAMENSQDALPYLVTEIFSELINIAQKDSSSLALPTERQMEIREKIIINELAKEKAIANKQDLATFVPPYNIDEDSLQEAMVLSDFEQAERNKEYALYTMAILAKVYADEIQKYTGNVVPLTDLPGASAFVDVLRQNDNLGVRVSAIDALLYINRPEYKDELAAIFEIAANDKEAYVAQQALRALAIINQ